MVKRTKEEETTPKVVPFVQKPKFSRERFKADAPPTIAGVETLLTELPHHKISEAIDWVRLHPDEDNYWTEGLCFVNVPIQGMKNGTLHMIDSQLALKFVQSKKILRFRLALATLPYDVRFLCHVPCMHLDFSWNKTNMQACEQAKSFWVQALSRKAEGREEYKIDYAEDQDAFPEPKWPTQTLDELIDVTFTGRMIFDEDHPAFARLVGRKQSLS
jgi:hypothetical protein